MAEAQLAKGQLSMEEAIPLLQVRADEAKLDSFKVKVQRKAGLGSTAVHIASLEEATIAQIANPEQWLPSLAGGGPIFVLGVCHATETIPNVWFQVPNLTGAPKQVIDPEVVKSPDWRGPPLITFPVPDTTKTRAVAASEVAQVRNLLGLPAPDATGQPGEKVDPRHAVGEPGMYELQRRMDMERIANVIADMQKASDRRFEQIASLVEKVAAAPARPPQKTLAESLIEAAPVITALGAVITPIITGSRATAAEQRASEQKARDELLRLVISSNEKGAAASLDVMKMISPLVEAASAASRASLQHIATMRELQAGEPAKSDLVQILEAGFGALAEFYAAKGAGPAVAPPQLPPRPFGQPRPAGPASARPGPSAASSNGTPPGEPQGQAQAPEPEGEGADGQLEWVRTHTAEEVLAATAEAIRQEADPATLAESFLDAATVNPGVMSAVQQAGDPVRLFAPRLGAEWIQGHMPYVQNLVAALSQSAARRQAEAQQRS